MRIHRMDYTSEWGWDYDEKNGPTRKEIRKYKLSDALTVSAGGGFRGVKEGTVFHLQPDGTFDVPDELGEFLCNTPGWYRGIPPVPPEKQDIPRRGPSRSRKEA